MLIFLGFAMIAVFMYLILAKKLTPAVALIIVPLGFGLIALATGVADDIEGGLPGAITKAIKDFAPTAALLFFAIIYFGLMIDVGLFDPLIRFILRVTGNNPVKVVIGTAVLAGLVSLDGDGSTTFIITVSALLPIYRRLGLSPIVLTVVANLANGVLNIVPWGGPTVRAATVLNVSPGELFNPMVPGMIAAMVVVILLAWQLGRSEKKRLARKGHSLEIVAEELSLVGAVAGPGTGTVSTGGGTTGGSTTGGKPLLPIGGSTDDLPELPADDDTPNLDPNRPTLRPKLIWFNFGLTVALLVALGLDKLPLSLVFMTAAALALMVNFPQPQDQSDRIKAHAGSIVAVVSMVFAAAVLVGVLSATGMVEQMATFIVNAVPEPLGPYFAVITGVLSMPLTFFMSNDAFYFGVLPILNEAAAHFGITPVEMARASIIGQTVHMTSPLVPAMLLLISLAKVDLADHHKKVIWRAVVCSLTMLAVSLAIGVIPFHA